MSKYDERSNLAPRDIVARAIDSEMKISGDEFVYLDCRHLDEKELKSHFPNITKKCKNRRWHRKSLVLRRCRDLR